MTHRPSEWQARARASYVMFLRSDCHAVVVGMYWFCRLFHDDPATSARFSHLDPRDRSHAPPCQFFPARACAVGPRRGIHSTVPQMRPYPRVVIVGAGFGGLQCAKALRDQPVDVVLVDRQNYHLFTPLLYQVASCLLNPSEIAAPLRKVLRGAVNVRYRRGRGDRRRLRATAGAPRRRSGARLRRAGDRHRHRHQLLRQRCRRVAGIGAQGSR